MCGLYALPLKTTYKARESSRHWVCDMGSPSFWHMSSLHKVVGAFLFWFPWKSVQNGSLCSSRSNPGLRQDHMEGCEHELPLAIKESSHVYFSYLHIPIGKLNLPSNPHITWGHIFKGTECPDCLARVSLFMQLLLTLASLSTMRSGDDRDHCSTGTGKQLQARKLGASKSLPFHNCLKVIIHMDKISSCL